MEKKKIQNLELREASYLGEKPEHPSWHIDRWQPNTYYGKEHLFIKDGDYYKYPDNDYCSIHKSCFKHPETCYSIAAFTWDSHEECFNFEFIEDRPLDLSEEEKKIFWELIDYGFKMLNNAEIYRD